MSNPFTNPSEELGEIERLTAEVSSLRCQLQDKRAELEAENEAAYAEVTRLRAALGEALDMAETMYTEFTALERVRLDRVMVDASGVPDHLARLRTLAGKET
jgi:DNA repair exonuclease SbcCD ATPase subunit